MSENLLADIYNYCDSWCERCLFTSRCRSFQLQQETASGKPLHTGDNLIQQLTDALNLTKRYVEQVTESTKHLPAEKSPDEPAQILEEKAVHREAYSREAIQHHPAILLARDYLRQSGAWLSAEKSLLEQAGRQQVQAVTLGLRTEQEAMAMLQELADAWEMIQWYRTLIPIKTQSVLFSLSESDNTQLANYRLGKVKLVLVSVDRSILAWQTIMRYFQDKTDNLLDLLILLTRLRSALEVLFPDARSFKRPGLD